MAHIATISALTDELILSLTSSSPSVNFPPTTPQFQLTIHQPSVHKETLLRTLLRTNHARTNQFEIESSLHGLIEKFHVLNLSPLAVALSSSLQKLERLEAASEGELKHVPEILHLLLNLSDRPAEKVQIEDIDFEALRGEKKKEEKYRWRDWIAEDVELRDKGVWRNVDFGAESSGDVDDEGVESGGEEGSEETSLSSLDGVFVRGPESYAVHTGGEEELGSLRDSHFWNKTPSVGGVKLETVKQTVTELQALREVLFMLGGHPTSLFDVDPEIRTVRPRKGFKLQHASNHAYAKLMGSFAEYGTAIGNLRGWMGTRQDVSLLQVFQGAIQKRVLDFDTLLSFIESRFVAPAEDVVVSLLSVQEEVDAPARLLANLFDLILTLDTDRNRHAFRYLELLYDDTCTAQMAGDDEKYSFMGRIFFECFQIYLRPIRLWMEDGELSIGDKVFFVTETAGEIDLASLWESRFKIRKTPEGVLHAPKFLHAVAGKIFTTGKSVVVLKHLNQFHELQLARIDNEPSLDFGTVCCPWELQLAPFPELFDMAFETWIQSKHQRASAMLRRTLFDSCGLHTSLEALINIYFVADGITGALFTNAIFDKLDTLNSSWNDRYTLTELAQSTFGSIPSITPDRLRASVLTLSRKNSEVSRCRRTVKALAILELRYQLSWPIQIVVTPATITAYKRTFVFLLQIRRSSHMLSRQRLVTDTVDQTHSSDERALYYSLRMRLLWFTQMLYYYLTSLVLTTGSKKMQEDLKNATDVDEMIHVHSSSIKRTIEQALLGSKLEPIHKTILKILDLAIKLEDAAAANSAMNRESAEKQKEMLGLSLASMGLHPAPKPPNFRQSIKEREKSPESSEDEEEVDVDLSVLSSHQGEEEREENYVERLRKMKGDFDRLVRFVAGGLRGVARAGGDEEVSRSWNVLGEMLEGGLESGERRW